MHMLLMPLSGAMPIQAKQQLGVGGHCAKAQMVGHGDHQPSDLDAKHHTVMQQCCCGAVSGALGALPSAAFNVYYPPLARLTTLPSSAPPALSPRRHWPSLNPRASPLV
jgi:hypothetical protein